EPAGERAPPHARRRIGGRARGRARGRRGAGDGPRLGGGPQPGGAPPRVRAVLARRPGPERARRRPRARDRPRPRRGAGRAGVGRERSPGRGGDLFHPSRRRLVGRPGGSGTVQPLARAWTGWRAEIRVVRTGRPRLGDPNEGRTIVARTPGVLICESLALASARRAARSP